MHPGAIKSVLEWFKSGSNKIIYEGIPNKEGTEGKILSVEDSLEMINSYNFMYWDLKTGMVRNESKFWFPMTQQWSNGTYFLLIDS